jgi:hypothetical protein
MTRKLVFATLLLATLTSLTFCGVMPTVKKEPDVIFIPTPHRVVTQMLQLANVNKGDLLYDLGSGDGRIVIAAAKDFGATAVGIELNQDLIDESLEKAKKAGVTDRTSFESEDFFVADISRATVVTLFLTEGVNEMLMPKLLKELKPGTRVITHRTGMGGWKPDVALRGYGSDVYLRFVPARMEGEWHFTISNQKEQWQQTFRFDQNYQVVRGADTEKKVDLRDIELYGNDVDMVLENRRVGPWSVIRLTGRVDGNSMEGTAVGKGRAGGEYSWKAVRILKDQPH